VADVQAVEIADCEHAPLERLLERPAAPHDAQPLDSRPRERPPLKTLWRHYAARFARAFAASLFILTLLVIAVDTLLELDEIPEDERTLGAAALRVGLRTLAQYFAYLVPAASFSAAFFTVAQGARAREVVALKAGGVNPLVAFLPVFVSALLAGLLLALVQETAGVRAAGALAGRAGASRGEVTRSGAIWYNAGRVIYSARESDPEGERVTDIHVLERDERGRLLRQIRAERAVRLSPQQWRFENAVVRSFDPAAPTAPPRFERAADVTLELAADRTPRLHPDELAALTLPTLGDYVSAVLSAGGSPGPARFAFHQRASAPALCLLFALLAVPLALTVETGGALAQRALQGVAWVALFLFLRDGARGFTQTGGPPAMWLPWAVLALFFALATVQLARAPR
jgi:lipopolysaccharide export LptBFGC system permease protein LptF